MSLKNKFAVTVLTIQISFIILFAFFVKYGQQMEANQDKYLEHQKKDPDGSKFHAIYPMFQDINALIFIGVGFLYTFLQKYGYMGVGMNMLLASISVQWSIFTHNWWTNTDGKIEIDFKSMVAAEYAAASVVISLGAIFGKTNPLQMVAFALIETFLYTTNEHLTLTFMKISDIGESVSLHLFAASFGLATAYALDRKKNVQNNVNDTPSYTSNLICMLGTVLLWCFWPTFNSALCEGDAQQRACLNTFIAFLSSILAAFATSSLMDKNNKFSMHHIQNATLAGGVAIGTTCDLMIQPYGALLIGLLGGCVCVLGFKFFGPFLEKMNVFDPCGIHSLHALPGVLAGITGVAAVFFATEDNYGRSLYKYYPAMSPAQNSSLLEFQPVDSYILAGTGRTATIQACFQFLYILECIALGIVTGLLTGLCLRIKWFEPLEEKQLYLDEVFWNLPKPEEETSDNKLQMKDTNT